MMFFYIYAKNKYFFIGIKLFINIGCGNFSSKNEKYEFLMHS